jgi:IS5 family transposase
MPAAGVPGCLLVHKGERPVTEADGKVIRKQIKYHGYKTHVSMDTTTRLVTALTTTTGSEPDCKQMPVLIALDRAVGVPARIYTADRAYDSGDNHQAIEDDKKGDAVKQNAYRTKKKDGNKEKWVEKQADPVYQEGLDERYTIEPKFGEAKEWHGFGRCRYRGRAGHIAQAFLTFMVLNLKRIVYLVTGVQLRRNSRRCLVTA